MKILPHFFVSDQDLSDKSAMSIQYFSTVVHIKENIVYLMTFNSSVKLH